jgi:hypothetical protein
MSSDSGDAGCLGCLFVVGLVICVLGYPFYDAYYYRQLDRDDIYKDTVAKVNCSSYSDNCYFEFVTKGEDSHWRVKSIKIQLLLSLKDGSSKSVSIMKADINDAPLTQLILPVPQDVAIYFRNSQVNQFTWEAVDSSARRKPMKIVRGIVEAAGKLLQDVKGLFER